MGEVFATLIKRMLHMSAKKTLFLIKIAISSGLLIFLISRVDHQKLLLNQLHQIPYFLVISLSFLILFTGVLQSIRWRNILYVQQYRIAAQDAISIVMLSLLFNQTLPSTIGGDAIRVWGAHRKQIPLSNALSSVFCDRFIALISILLMCLVGLPFLWQYLPNDLIKHSLLIVLLLVSLCIVIFLTLPLLPQRFARRYPLRVVVPLVNPLFQLIKKPLFLFKVVSLSILIQMFCIFSIYSIGVFLHFGVSLCICFALFPVVILLSMLPLSIAGWGVREGLIMVALGFFGVTSEKAIFISILYGFILLAAGLLGGLYWLTRFPEFNAMTSIKEGGH